MRLNMLKTGFDKFVTKLAVKWLAIVPANYADDCVDILVMMSIDKTAALLFHSVSSSYERSVYPLKRQKLLHCGESNRSRLSRKLISVACLKRPQTSD